MNPLGLALEESLVRAWSRSQAKHLALEQVDPHTSALATRDAALDLPERLIARVSELRAEREEARAAARSAPHCDLTRVAELREQRERSGYMARQAHDRIGRLGGLLEGTPAWRRRERGELKRRIVDARRELERYQATGRSAEAELARLAPMVDRHHDRETARERARDLGRELDTATARLDEWASGIGRVQDRGLEISRERAPIERDFGREM